MRWLLVFVLACGGKKDEAKPAPAEVAAVAAKPTLLDEAKQILATGKRRDAPAWLALAWAQHAAKQDAEAAKSLAIAIDAARVDPVDRGGVLVQAAELASSMGDGRADQLLEEGIAAVKQANARDDKIATLLSPVVALDWHDAIQPLVDIGIEAHALDAIISRVAVSPGPNDGHAWRDIVASAVVLPVPPERAIALIALSRRSRRSGHPDPARLLAEGSYLDMANSPALASVLLELAISGDANTAVKYAKTVEKQAHSQEAAERAVPLAQLAELYAIAGNASASEATEKKAMLAAEKAGDELGEDSDEVWVSLAIARAKRKNVDGALALVREHLKGDAIGDLAYELVEVNERDAAQRVLAELKDEQQFEAIADIVQLEAERGELDLANRRMLAAPQWKGARPGIDHVMRQYALAGDVKAVRELGAQRSGGLKTIQLDSFTDLAARMLAHRGKCEEAVAASKDVVVRRGECLAVIARYCPNSNY